MVTGSVEERKEVARRRAIEWYRNNKERARATRQAYYQANKKEVAGYNRDYRRMNREKLEEYERRRARSEKRLQAAAEWRSRPENSARIIQRVKEWQARNPERAKRSQKERNAARRAREKMAVAERVDLFRFRVVAEPICGICGSGLDKRKAEIDHIVPLSKSGGHVWGNLQLAHRTCNRRKGNRLQDTVYSL